ncbi:Collagen alpha-1(XXVII) chain, partial [Frankliniella fusca]
MATATFWVIVQNLHTGLKDILEANKVKVFPKGVRKTKTVKEYTSLEPTNETDFKKRSFYGIINGDFMQKVWILAMKENKKDLEEVFHKTRTLTYHPTGVEQEAMKNYILSQELKEARVKKCLVKPNAQANSSKILLVLNQNDSAVSIDKTEDDVPLIVGKVAPPPEAAASTTTTNSAPAKPEGGTKDSLTSSFTPSPPLSRTSSSPLCGSSQEGDSASQQAHKTTSPQSPQPLHLGTSKVWSILAHLVLIFAKLLEQRMYGSC